MGGYLPERFTLLSAAHASTTSPQGWVLDQQGGGGGNYVANWGIYNQFVATGSGVNAPSCVLGAMTVAPDGTNTAQHIAEAAVNTQHLMSAVYFIGGTCTQGGYTMRLAVFAKAAERSRIFLSFRVGPDGSFAFPNQNQIYAVFDLANGVVVAKAGLNPASTSQTWQPGASGCLPFGNGWFCCYVDCIYTHGYYPFQIMNFYQWAVVGIDNGTGSGSFAPNTAYLGDGTSGVYFWKTSCLPPIAWQQISGTNTVLFDDFTSLNNIDLNNTRNPGYLWYPYNQATSVPAGGTFYGNQTAPPSTFSIVAGTQLKMSGFTNPSGNQSTMMTIAWLGAPGVPSTSYVGKTFSWPWMYEENRAIDTSTTAFIGNEDLSWVVGMSSVFPTDSVSGVPTPSYNPISSEFDFNNLNASNVGGDRWYFPSAYRQDWAQGAQTPGLFPWSTVFPYAGSDQVWYSNQVWQANAFFTTVGNAPPGPPVTPNGFSAAGTLSAAAAGTSITPALPTLPFVGVWIAFVATANNATHTWPAGWTKAAQANSGASWTVSWAWRIPQSGDVAPNVTWTGSAANTGQVWTYADTTNTTGVDQISPIGAVSAASTGSGATHTSASITTTRSASRVIYLDVSAANTALTTPAGYVSNVSNGSATSTSHDDTGSKTVATSGSATGAISTTGAVAPWVQWQIEILTQFEWATITHGEWSFPVAQQKFDPNQFHVSSCVFLYDPYEASASDSSTSYTGYWLSFVDALPASPQAFQIISKIGPGPYPAGDTHAVQNSEGNYNTHNFMADIYAPMISGGTTNINATYYDWIKIQK